MDRRADRVFCGGFLKRGRDMSARAVGSRAGDSARLGLILLLLPAALWLGVLVLVPMSQMLLISVQERVAPRVYSFGFANYLEFFVEAVLTHRGQPNRILTFQFLIKWLGYDFPD